MPAPVEENSSNSAATSARKMEPHRVATDESGQKHVEKQTNHHDREGAQPNQRDFLNAQQKLPADSRQHFDRAITDPTDYHPNFAGVPQCIR
jgi:hypothetical protein